jgi:hypothetical protein
MSLITPANPFICTEVDVAFDADLTAPSESWDWTTMGDYTAEGRTRPRLLNQTIEIQNGRRDESRLADPSTVDIGLGNGDLALTPRNPSSPYHPGLKRGTPLQVVVQAGLPHLLLTGLAGSRARTANHASLNVAADLSFALELLSPVRVPPFGVTYELVSKYVVTGNQRSWLLALNSAGELVFFWSPDGTSAPSKLSSLSLACPEAGAFTIGGWFDVNNGAGGNTLTWYTNRGTVEDLRADLSGSVFGDPDTDSGTTSFFSSTAPIDIGDNEGVSSFTPYPGRLNRFQLRAGDLSTGTIVANLDCTTLTPGATGVTDSAGRTWSFSGAGITNRRPRFCGRVDKVTAEWEVVDEDNPLSPTIAYAHVSASGMLERLTQGDSIGSALARAVSAPVNRSAVIAAWMFEGGRDSENIAQSVSGAAPMSIRGEFTFGGDSSYNSVEQQLTIGSGDNAYMSAPIPEIPQVVGVNWQITRFIRINDPAVSPATTQLMAVDSNGRVATWRVTINDTQLAISGLDIDGVGVVLATLAADTRWFDTEAQIVLEVTDDGADVDWAVHVVPVPLGVVFSTSGTFTGNTGIPTKFRNSCTGPPSGISLGPLIVTTDRAVGWLAPADTAFVGEPAPQRVFRLCQERGLPVAVDGPYGTDWDAAIAAGAQAMGPQLPGQILDLLDECAEADLGIVGEQRGGLGLTYRSGASRRNQAVRLTLERARRQVIEPFEEVDDDQRFTNDVTTSRPEGSSYRIEDPAIAAGTEERYDKTYDVNVASDLQLPAQAGWRYHLGTWDEPRFPQVATDVAKTADLVEDILGFGVGDRFEVPDPPPGCPPVDQLADGITEELERFQWRVALNGHPARPWDTAIVDDGDFGRVDTAGSETAAQFIAGTSTSMSVTTTLGPVWVTSASEFPFDINVAGVRLRVTAITGASSPQTFTITQTPVNGVTKTIPAGSPVELWQGAVIAL